MFQGFKDCQPIENNFFVTSLRNGKIWQRREIKIAKNPQQSPKGQAGASFSRNLTLRIPNLARALPENLNL